MGIFKKLNFVFFISIFFFGLVGESKSQAPNQDGCGPTPNNDSVLFERTGIGFTRFVDMDFVDSDGKKIKSRQIGPTFAGDTIVLAIKGERNPRTGVPCFLRFEGISISLFYMETGQVYGVIEFDINGPNNLEFSKGRPIHLRLYGPTVGPAGRVLLDIHKIIGNQWTCGEKFPVTESFLISKQTFDLVEAITLAIGETTAKNCIRP